MKASKDGFVVNRWGERYQPALLLSSGNRSLYNDDFTYLEITLSAVKYTADYHVRGVSDDDVVPGSAYLCDLSIRAMVHAAHPTWRAYDWKTVYRQPYEVGIHEAALMYATLTKVQKSLAKMNVQYGDAASFGQYAARVAQALGITTLLHLVDRRGVSTYDDMDIRVLPDAAALVRAIDRIVDGFLPESVTVPA